MVINFLDQGLIHIERLVMQDVGHQHDVVGAPKAVPVEVSRSERNARLQAGIFDRGFRKPQRGRKIEDRGRELRINLAEGNGVCSCPASQVEKMKPPSELESFGELRTALTADAMKHGEDMTSQLRISFKDTPVHGPRARTDGLFQPSPVVPLRVVQEQEMADVL